MYPIPDLHLPREREFQLSPLLRQRLEELDVQQIDAAPGPAELTVMGIKPDLVFAKEAWPHVDPDWEGRVFFTMTADGGGFDFGSLSRPKGMRVPAGKVFYFDPLELHWLRPDPVVSCWWLGLQWDVSKAQEAAFADDLAAAIGRWNEAGFVLPMLGK
ncbi:hypothetical protein WJ96_05620 [Burkholderia ubonensis]|uniref:AraC-type arabinose-binding/dimerisation domain-containing protein n=1 Tax=Burkholderia ubonensis TaxID=101571 RepID=A0AAW3MXK4_9BURK|nr:hypothetical protein [Burkholderia ubonensis]KVP75235.1 hypothetical protein WJ93_07415 [Burkholderia ubonensis]KVP96706.1 hypothetical protein WJ97_12555 [Burkholderia ubonensis]KVP98048.1 hypothetical protein WJ96_05620 [Burkholderia ubonensis]KVZ92745.1 hypothetical protein WL25_17280 [Burkholderia ubonensis]